MKNNFHHFILDLIVIWWYNYITLNQGEIMNKLGRDFVIKYAVLHDFIRWALPKRSDTNTPDSLGDKLFRMSLKISWHSRCGTMSTTIYNEAKKLLDLHNAERALYWEDRMIKGNL